jgi:putative PIN family toxin of toxin-antitoxin system
MALRCWLIVFILNQALESALHILLKQIAAVKILFYSTIYSIMRIVIDTNVLFAGFYSKNGASHQVLLRLASKQLTLALSTPLLFEYEDVLKRNPAQLGLDEASIDLILDNLCAMSQHQRIYYLWRPYLPDAKDDMLLELAVASNTNTIVTHNLKDFSGIVQFGVEAITPKNLLERLP